MKIKQIAAGALAVIGIGTFTVFGLTKNDVDNEPSASSVTEESIMSVSSKELVSSEIISQESSEAVSVAIPSEPFGVTASIETVSKATSTDAVTSVAEPSSAETVSSDPAIVSQYYMGGELITIYRSVETSRPTIASRP